YRVLIIDLVTISTTILDNSIISEITAVCYLPLLYPSFCTDVVNKILQWLKTIAGQSL
ncbi:hypothetical protein BgiBS90_005196, partial [Biomphalaria glabrata]